ncbi:MAG: hypothetical protein Q8N26_32810 [Myxococcales bacterium]|nr:hypothetical protein [Myxococcales bacterium]
MLRLVLSLGLGVATVAFAEAAPRPSGIVEVRQLTSGTSDQFFGQLHPDGRTLFFASNASGTVELSRQVVGSGAPALLFDEQADISQPRLSPDGAFLLYVSYRRDAFGDACVLELSTLTRRCFDGNGAVLHAFWFADSRRFGLVSRAELGGVHRVFTFRRDEPEASPGELVSEGLISSPVASPDGRWLVGVAQARVDDGGVGTVLRAKRGLVLVPLAGGEPIAFQPNYPGTTAHPAFSTDGAFLYFTQFPDDTNADGVTDGNDKGVLARVPWQAGGVPADGALVEALTSQKENCQYPMPARAQLIATCTRREALQLVSLPLEGQVPVRTDAARLDAEADASRERWERLLLQEHRLELERDPRVRIGLERRLAMAHLELGANESAEFDLTLMTNDAGSLDDAAEAAWAQVAIELVNHRRDEGRLGFGKLSDDFVAKEKVRLARLKAGEAKAPPNVRRLSMVVRAEVLRVLGRKAEALELFEAVDLETERDPDVVLLWGRLAERLWREYDDRPRWARAMLQLSAHAALTERERLLHARRFVDVLTRGRPVGERLEVLRTARASVRDGTEAALLVDVELALDAVDRMAQLASLPVLDALWRSAPTFEAHRTLAMTIIERAGHDDLELLLDVFGKRWLDDVPEGHAERKYAEALYAEVLLEHAYVELSRDAFAAAAELFLTITVRTRSLEALSGYVEASLRGGVDGVRIISAVATTLPGPEWAPLRSLAEALVLGRQLPALDDPGFRVTLTRARSVLQGADEALARTPELHHLYGYLAHEDFHRFGTRASALEAHGRYHLALDLAPGVYRRRATLLVELGLLQAALGNHRLALKHFDERARLPIEKPAEGLAFRLSRARSLFHAGRLEQAAAEAQAGLALVEQHPQLARFRALALERALFCHLVAGQYEAAAREGEALLPLLPASTAAQVKARLGLGLAYLKGGRAADATKVLAAARAVLDAPLPLHTTEALAAHGPTHLSAEELRALVAGLDAEVKRAAGDSPGRLVALRERQRVLEARQAAAPRDETLQALATNAHHRAQTLATLGQWPEAELALRQGLTHAETWRSHTGAQFDPVSVGLLQLCAEFTLARGAGCPVPQPSLVEQLGAALRRARKDGFVGTAELRVLVPALLARLEASGSKASP